MDFLSPEKVRNGAKKWTKSRYGLNPIENVEICPVLVATFWE